ncbi:MAG: hypothetical protein WCO35_02760 [Candidatus Nomurabacteria bacterium]
METIEIPMIHEAIHTPKKGDIILELTDIQYHTNITPTTNIVKKIRKAIFKNQKDRIYSPIDKLFQPIIAVKEDGVMKYSVPFIDQEQISILLKKFHSEGKRVFIKKTNNIQVLPGKDTIEFINSIKGKRILRKFDKDQ